MPIGTEHTNAMSTVSGPHWLVGPALSDLLVERYDALFGSCLDSGRSLVGERF